MSARPGQYRLSGVKVLLAATAISLVGSLPPGTTNVLTVQLAATDGLATAGFFALGCLVAEVVYVALSMSVMDRLLRYERIIKLMQWISFGILIALAVGSFVAAVRNSPHPVVQIVSGHSPFVFGFILMIINPLQLPFWIGWTTVLLEKKVLHLHWSHYILYPLGGAIGSLLASILFIVAGTSLFQQSFVTQKHFHYIIAAIFLISAALQVLAIIKNSSPVGPVRRSMRI